MACGNNKVSRDGLRTQPTEPAPPAPVNAGQRSREAAQQSHARAEAEMSSATLDVHRSTSSTDVNHAVSRAKNALDAARRAGVPRDQLRALERAFDKLKTDARDRSGQIDTDLHHRHQIAAWSRPDRLSPKALGLPVVAIGTPPTPPRPERPLPLLRTVDPGYSPATPRPPRPKHPRNDNTRRPQAVDSRVSAAQDAARRCDDLSMEDLTQAMKDAHRTLAALRRAGAPDKDIAALAEVAKIIQRAEAKRRAIPGPASGDREGTAAPQILAFAESGQTGSNPQLNQTLPASAVVVDGKAVYESDDLGRVVRAQTVLDQLAVSTRRNPYQQSKAGGSSRLPTDDGGHIFATMFGGTGEAINIQAMDFEINRGLYLDLERTWRRQIEGGGQVHVEVNFDFEGESRRPTQFEVVFHFGDGDVVRVPFYQ